MIYKVGSEVYSRYVGNPFPQGKRVMLTDLQVPHLNGRIGRVKGCTADRVQVSLVSEQNKQTYSSLLEQCVLKVKLIKPDNLKPLGVGCAGLGADDFDDYPMQLSDGQYYLACVRNYLAKHYQESPELRSRCFNVDMNQKPLILELGAGRGLLGRYMQIAGSRYPMMLSERSPIHAKELSACTVSPNTVVGIEDEKNHVLTCDIERLPTLLEKLKVNFLVPCNPSFLVMKDVLDMFALSEDFRQKLESLWDALPVQGRVLSFNTKNYFEGSYRYFLEQHRGKIPIFDTYNSRLHYFDDNKNLLKTVFPRCSERFSSAEDFQNYLGNLPFREINQLHSHIDEELIQKLKSNGYIESVAPIELSNILKKRVEGMTENFQIKLNGDRQFEVVCNEDITYSFPSEDTIGVDAYKGCLKFNQKSIINVKNHVLVLEKK